MKWSYRLLTVLLFLNIQTAFAKEQYKIVATASMLADMARNIAGDAATVQSIVPIGGDPHIYNPTPADAQLVAKADIIFKNGLTFEGWLNKLIQNSGTRAVTFRVTTGVQAIESLTYQNATDPHAWMSAAIGVKYAENIYHALAAYDPDNKDMYAFNFEIYKKQLEDMDAYIMQQIQKIPEERRVLITSHDAFQYYGRRYGIQLESVLGISTDAEVQTSDIIRLNRIIAEKNIPAVFIESTINPKLLQQLARDNNIEIGGKLYADSLGEEGGPASTYLDMLKHNTDTIVAALTKSKSTGEPEAEGSDKNWLLWGVLAVLLFGGFLVVFKKLN